MTTVPTGSGAAGDVTVRASCEPGAETGPRATARASHARTSTTLIHANCETVSAKNVVPM